MYKVFGTILICWFFVTSNYEYANASEFGPFQGKIVDAETKEPIEGAVVLIEWRERHASSGTTFYDAQAVLTDKSGEFLISGIWVINPLVRLRAEADVIIYKTGYGTTDGINLHGTWQAFIEKEWGAPKGTYIWKFEDEKPIILLKKLTIDERKQYSTPGWSDIPSNKAKLLIQEINKERKFIGLDEVGPIRRR